MLLSRLLKDPEQPRPLEARSIGLERARAADEKWVSRMGLSEGMEAPVEIDVIDDYNASGPQKAPSLIELEAGIVFRMDAVVKEQVDRTEGRE